MAPVDLFPRDFTGPGPPALRTAPMDRTPGDLPTAIAILRWLRRQPLERPRPRGGPTLSPMQLSLRVQEFTGTVGCVRFGTCACILHA
jgi:hypothetical protein